MNPHIATLVYAIGIVGLFILDRDRKSHTSKALWIPVVWLLIAGSRPMWQWFYPQPTALSADKYNIEADPGNVVVFSVLLAAGLIVLANRRQQVGTLLQANWPILLFFSYCALSTLWSDYPGAAFRHWVRSSGDLVMVLIVLTDFEPVAALKRVLARTGFVLIPLSVLLIKYYPDLGRAYSNDWELMYTGVTDHKNSLGALCMVLGLGFLWRFLERCRTKGEPHRGRHLLANGAILALVIWLLWMANSVTSSSCFLMASALMAVTSLSAPGRKLGVVHLLVAALVSLSLFALFFDPEGGLVESLGRNPTLTGRTAIWHQVLGLARNPVFGTGFESFWLGNRIQAIWDNNVGDMLNEAHNGYLEVYLNLGWCGVTLLAVLILTGYRNVIVAFRRDAHVGNLKLAYFVAALIYNLTEAAFRMMSFTWIFFLLVTAALPKASAPKAANEGATRGEEQLGRLRAACPEHP
jgi:O-antigen ligase